MDQIDDIKENQVDFKGLFRLVLRFWYLFVFFIGTSYVASMLYLRYQDPLFMVTSSLIVKTQDTEIEKQMGGLGILGADKNVTNQMAILRSFGLIFKSIQKDNFLISYYHKGDIRLIELYNNRPYNVVLDTSSFQISQVPIYVTILKNKKCHLKTEGPVSANIYDINTFTTEGAVKAYSLDTVIEFGQPFRDKFMSFTVFLNDPEARPSEPGTNYFMINDLSLQAQKFKTRLLVSQEGKLGSVILLTLIGPVVQKDIDFLNNLVSTYIQNSLDEKNKIVLNTMAFIDEQLDRISNELQGTEDERESFLKRVKTFNFNSAAQNEVDKLSNLDAKKANLQINISYYEYLQDYIVNNKDAKDLVVPSAIGISDPSFTRILVEFINLQTEKAAIVSGASKTNPYIINLDKQIQVSTQTVLEYVSNLIQNSYRELHNINQRISQSESLVSDLPSKERKLIEIERRFNLNEHLFNFLMQRRAEAGITKSANKPDHKVVEEARLLAAVQTSPDVSRIKLTAIVSGFLIPTIIVLLVFFLNNKIMGKEMIERYTNVPVLGIVGHNNHQSSLLVVSEYPKSAIAESIRSIRINLSYIAPDKQNKIICITSSISGEGKSFLSANLATIIAMAGSKVVLIGADMRKAGNENGLNLSNEKGLSGILSNKFSLDECLQQTETPNLSVIMPGIIPPNPSELLALPRMKQLLDELKVKFEIIIIDTPPIGLVSDALILFEYTNINLFVVRYNYSTVQMVKELDNIVQTSRIEDSTLIIANDVEEDVARYGYKNKYGYAYYNDYESANGSNKFVSRIKKLLTFKK